MRYCNHWLSGICHPPINQQLLQTTFPKQLAGVSLNFTGIVCITCIILVVMATERKNFKNLLVENYLHDLNTISDQWSLINVIHDCLNQFEPLKHGCQGQGEYFLYDDRGKQLRMTRNARLRI